MSRRPALLLVVCLALAGWLAFRFGRQIDPWPPAPTTAGWSAHVRTVAGDGAPGLLDGLARHARFADPFGLAVDRSGRLYVGDAGVNNRIRRLDPDGTVETVAGGVEGFADGFSPAAAFRTPSGLAVDEQGFVYVADTGNHAIRRISPDGHVTTLAGDGRPGNRDGAPEEARFDAPLDLAVAADGGVYVADTYNDSIRLITPTGRVTTIAGGAEPGYRDGPAPQALFDTPCALALAPNGDLVIADSGNDAVRRLSVDGGVHTVATVARPLGIAVSHDGFIYVTDGAGRVIQITPDAELFVMADSEAGFQDGPGPSARFQRPAGIAVARDGRVYVADSANYLIRLLEPVEDEGSELTGIAVQAAEPDAPPRIVPRLFPTLVRSGPLSWPLAPQDLWHELTGTIGEARGSTEGLGHERFHAGIDVKGDYGASVLAVRDEKVSDPLPVRDEGGYAESLTVGLVTYVHLRVGRDSRDRPFDDGRFQLVGQAGTESSRVRVRRGTRFRVGDPVGTINRAHHAHLNVGPPGAEINPLRLSPARFRDTIAPTIVPGGIVLTDERGEPFEEVAEGRRLVTGRARIVVEAFDRVDGNAARRRLGLYRLGYQILHDDGSPAPGFERPRITIEFDRLPADADAPLLAYADGSGITVYGNAVTRFRYVVTNTVRQGRAAPGWWDTRELPSGDYTLRIVAEDLAGNAATEGRDLRVRVF